MKQVVLLVQLHSSICIGEAEGHGVPKSVPTLYVLYWIKDCYTGHVRGNTHELEIKPQSGL